MLIRLLNPKDKFFQPCILTTIRQQFSKMPYFRQMATKLNITVPKINEQISVESRKLCTVYGISEIDPDKLLALKESSNEEVDEKGRKVKYFDEETVSGFVVDKAGKMTIEFGLAQRIATNLQLDICLMKEGSQIQVIQKEHSSSLSSTSSPSDLTVLSLTRFRQYIYRQYYVKQLKNKSKRKYIESELTSQNLLEKSQWSPNSKGSYKNRIKTVRIGEDVHNNDLNYKKSQIDAWIGQGQRMIKVISHNDSSKSYKAIEKFCKMVGKEVEIVEEKIKNQNPRKKPIIRYTAMLKFDEQIEVDFDFVNRRWRRRQAEIKLTLSGQNKKPSIFNFDMTKQDAIYQKAYLAAFDQAGIPYPKEYNFLTEFDKAFEKQGVMSMVKQVVQQNDRKIKEQNLDPYEGDVLTQEQRKQRDKQNRRIMGLRTVEDILEEMEEMKSREYQMEQYESSRYKELEKELTDMLKNVKKYAQRQVQN